MDVLELAHILADDDPPQKIISKGKKIVPPLVAGIDDADDADGEWVWK
jgi:hypothetical protein